MYEHQSQGHSFRRPGNGIETQIKVKTSIETLPFDPLQLLQLQAYCCTSNQVLQELLTAQ